MAQGSAGPDMMLDPPWPTYASANDIRHSHMECPAYLSACVAGGEHSELFT